MKLFIPLLACALLAGCTSMPYRPAVADGAFPGLADFAAHGAVTQRRSNAPTWLGLLERPDHAHTNYLLNPDVARMVACGEPRSARCE